MRFSDFVLLLVLYEVFQGARSLIGSWLAFRRYRARPVAVFPPSAMMDTAPRVAAMFDQETCDQITSRMDKARRKLDRQEWEEFT